MPAISLELSYCNHRQAERVSERDIEAEREQAINNRVPDESALDDDQQERLERGKEIRDAREYIGGLQLKVDR